MRFVFNRVILLTHPWSAIPFLLISSAQEAADGCIPHILHSDYYNQIQNSTKTTSTLSIIHPANSSSQTAKEQIISKS